MRRNTLIAVAAGAVLVTAGTAVVAVGVSTSDHAPPEAKPEATSTALPPSGAEGPALDAPELATAFLDDWVEGGRVVRHDEGGDTVSEGQAYGLFAAVIAEDEERFDEIWEWTQEELVRPDGLMAWRWDDGEVVDDEPASDADLDAARALVLAGDRFGRADLREDGVELAAVIADRLTVETDRGRILLPGLWAADRQPYAYNPSYASPVAFDLLGAATGDPRWTELQAGSANVTSEILNATDLPPDWAQVHADGLIEPMPGPLGEGDPVQYAFDAPRLLLRYAESCAPDDIALAGLPYSTLDREQDVSARLDLGGGALVEEQSPLGFTARAASAQAAGDGAAAIADLERAADLATEFPTYYGAAWVMLSTAMLTDDALGGCGTGRV
ncbi:glycosyl hydrolase family 8 [Microbacterium phyllosphaerae]|uniref:glycosyl hydrolase family 8 n=1 Tax=Microbacterium phyllosphaerae TaxID=124798 RepID=UPI000EA30D03|nr:glycosyl hydrolase family 8 [Microbacterium phyllosphaerae]